MALPKGTFLCDWRIPVIALVIQEADKGHYRRFALLRASGSFIRYDNEKNESCMRKCASL